MADLSFPGDHSLGVGGFGVVVPIRFAPYVAGVLDALVQDRASVERIWRRLEG